MPLSLCYHAVSETLDCPLAVTTAQLRGHMRAIADAGYTVVTDHELDRRRRAGEDCSRTAAISFDDGYVSTLAARDVLAEFGFVGTVYVLPDLVGSGRPLRWRGIETYADGPHGGELIPMDWEQVVELKASGWEIGSHTLTHPDLTSLADDALAEELRTSRARLVDRLGECDSIAYPYGLAGPREAAAARSAGYATGVTLPGWIRHDEPLLRPRLGIYRGDGPRRYRVKISRPLTAARSLPLLFTRRSS